MPESRDMTTFLVSGFDKFDKRPITFDTVAQIQ